MFEVYRKLFSLLDPRERLRGAVLFLMLLTVAFLEMLGIASIMPFVAVLANPDVIEANPYLATVYAWSGLETTNAFLTMLGAVFFFILTGSLGFKAFTNWVQVRYTQMRLHTLSCRLMERYATQPYEFFLNRTSADISAALLNETEKVISGALFPAIQLVAQTLVVIAILSLLVVIDPVLAALVGLALGGAYATTYLLVRRYLSRIGAKRLKANRKKYGIVQEAFGGIKDVKIAGLENAFLQRFRNPSAEVARYNVSQKVISEVPGFALQGLVFGGMILIVLYLMAVHGNVQQALPTLAAYAFAGYRLMPALQNGYLQLTQLRFSRAALDSVYEDYHQLERHRSHQHSAHAGPNRPVDRLQLKTALQFQKVSYTYPNADRPALDQLNLSIAPHTTVGLVGPSGSGKTTTVDIILGLLRPSQGRVRIDGVSLDASNTSLWQRNLGYVPQSIFLTNDSVAANIAFGIPPERIDPAAVERAARVAQLHDFVTTEMPHGYDTFVGERGVRLSGGQRQRIGIARALYHDPDVLVLDEATSALDNLTEQSVMNAIHALGGKKTIIIIAHRLSTVEGCDCLFLLEHGQCVASGNYHQLLESSDAFRRMAAKPGDNHSIAGIVR